MREVLGNTASEQAAHDAGMSFESLNHGSLPESRPDAMEVDAEYVSGDGLTLTPKSVEGFHRALGDLKEGPMDQLTAQLCEEPDTTALAIRKIGDIEVQGDPSRLAMVSRRNPREELVWYGMHPEYYGAVAGDRIMLRRDILESQYSCKACKGLGYDDGAICGNCGGHAKETVRNQAGESTEAPCRVCRVSGYGKEVWYSCGKHKCSKCNGSGWRGGIIIPEESQSQAITGVVVSVGPDVRTWKIGDRLMFSRYAGHTLEVSKTESFIMMRESEAIGMLRQRGEKL